MWLHFLDSNLNTDKRLFTPGPLICSASIKAAMMRDLGSRDIEFIETVQLIRDELLKVADVDSESWTTVPMQGSGTFAVEAVFQTATPRKNGKVINRVATIMTKLQDSNLHFRTSRPWLLVTFRPKKSNLAQKPRSREVPEESLHIPLRDY